MNQQLHDYIDGQIKSGVSKDVIEQSLLVAGWKLEDVNSEFVSFEVKPVLVPAPSINQITPSIRQISPNVTQITYEPTKLNNSTISSVQLVNKGSGRHPVVKALIGCIALFVLFGGSYLGYQYYTSYALLRDAKSAFKEMPSKMANLSKFSYMFESKILINPDANARQNAQLGKKQFEIANLSGLLANFFKVDKIATDYNYVTEAQTPENWLIPKSLINNALNLRISGSYENTGAKRNFSTLFDFSAAQQDELITALSVEYRRINDTNFFRVIEVPAELMPVISSSLPGLQPLNFLKKWFSVKDKTIVDLQIFPTSTIALPEPNIDIAKRNQELFDKSDLFELKSAFLDTSVPGNSYVTDIDIKPENLKTYLKESIKINQDRSTTKQEETYIDIVVQNLSKATITLWISAKEHYLQKAEITASSTTDGNTVHFDSILAFTDFETAKVAEPIGATVLDDELTNFVYDMTHPISGSPLSDPFYKNLALSSQMIEAKKYFESLHYSELALINAKNDQEKAAAHVNEGAAYFYLKNYKQAEIVLKQAIELDSRSAPAYIVMSSVYFETKRYQEALNYANNGIKYDPKHQAGYAWAGRAQAKLGKLNDAINSFSVAIELKPSKAELYYERSIAYYLNKNTNSAIADLEKAILLDSTFEGAYINLSGIYMETKNWTKAIEVLKKGVANIPTSSTLRNTLDFALKQKK